ncbi:hypothetical protein [Thioalkalivibrio paradoxus]|uniref:Uncharacterized protein n=1 Tax=Thioalkalivibrio paradoxus ARh 1 TaxID=713585 RepID=W0DMJ5_9GAMM|nr:hypothetical protein [Thioalkalivibrio paradoxus]AHE99809.1 hypothetical protein THITH_00370 [Thioalkalivibrio paradoxus ARh 1]
MPLLKLRPIPETDLAFLRDSITGRTAMAVVLAVLVYAAYTQGVTGSAFYDDYSNLDGLSSIQTRQDARDYALGGTSGPLGRPIAYASFVLHADDWPDVESALRLNVTIHLVNAALLFWLGYLLLTLRDPAIRNRAYYIALFAAFLWASLPILASTTLITVQRMTSLAALFGLLGLIAFVIGYRFQERRPTLALLIQGIGLGVGTLLGLFTKESAALIPVFALIIDLVLFRKLPGSLTHIRLRRLLLWAWLLAILYYLSPINRDWFAAHPERGFSPFERLLTQSTVLWKYVAQSFFPKPLLFGPFHDDVRLVDGMLRPLVAGGAILIAVFSAYLLRKYSVWPLFAVLWFLTGHLLESTVINLELYFEHRNYLALYGIVLAVTYGAWQVPEHLRRLVLTGFLAYAALMWSLLLAVTLLWGNPHAAAENWADQKPRSSRAALHLGLLDYEALGGSALLSARSLIGFQRQAYANRALDRTAAQCPTCIDLRLQALLFACNTEPREAVRLRFEDLVESAAAGRPSVSLNDGLFPLREMVLHDACEPLTPNDVERFVSALLDNPAFHSRTHFVRATFILASLADDRDDHATVDRLLTQAEQRAPEALPVLQFQVYSLLKRQRFDDASAAIERRRPLVGTRQAPTITAPILNELAQTITEARNDALGTD